MGCPEGLAKKNSWYCLKQYLNTLAKKKAPCSLIPHLDTSILTTDLKMDILAICQHMKIQKHVLIRLFPIAGWQPLHPYNSIQKSTRTPLTAPRPGSGVQMGATHEEWLSSLG